MGVAKILRGCVRPGVDAGFLVRGGDWGAEGTERGAYARSAGAPRGVRSGEGRRTLTQDGGRGHSPREIFEI